MSKSPTDVSDVMRSLPAERRKRIKKGASELIAIEASLQELRKMREITQERIAEILDLRQENISKFESRADVRLSSLQNYIRALGGQLKLIAEFPDSESYEISNFSLDK